MMTLALFSPVVVAAEAVVTPSPQPFAPIVLQQQDIKSLTDYVATLPYGQAAPIMQFLAQKEAEAQHAATAKPVKP